MTKNAPSLTLVKNHTPQAMELCQSLDRLTNQIQAVLGKHPVLAETSREILEDAVSITLKIQDTLTENLRQIERLKRLSLTDDVTGLLNRRGFSHSLGSALARARRSGEVGSVLMIDLDDFKSINDTFGHQAGDLVLSAVGSALKGSVRATDAVARIGGDEFAIVLVDTNAESADRKAAATHALLNELHVPWQGRSVGIRASVGQAEYGPDGDADDIIKRADASMYYMKVSASQHARPL